MVKTCGNKENKMKSTSKVGNTPKPANIGASLPAMTHKAKFEQILDDAVLGVKKK